MANWLIDVCGATRWGERWSGFVMRATAAVCVMFSIVDLRDSSGWLAVFRCVWRIWFCHLCPWTSLAPLVRAAERERVISMENSPATRLLWFPSLFPSHHQHFHHHYHHHHHYYHFLHYFHPIATTNTITSTTNLTTTITTTITTITTTTTITSTTNLTTTITTTITSTTIITTTTTTSTTNLTTTITTTTILIIAIPSPPSLAPLT